MTSHRTTSARRGTRRRAHRRGLALAAVTALVASLTAACGGGDDDSADGAVELSVATFNEFGYEELIEEWNAENPDIQVTQRKVANWDEAKDNLYTKLAANSGLSDIEAIEGDAMRAILAESGAFVDLADPAVEGRWYDFVETQATDDEGQLIGYGTDIGPEGICYRADLFEQAGLPTDREEVAGLMGTWEDYYATGERFTQAMPDTAWYDSSGSIGQAMINQIEYPFENADGEIDVENPELEAVWQTVTSNAEAGLSTRLAQWSDDWTASFQNDGHATMPCPGWMLGIVEGNAAGVEGWDFADVFPGGAGNWGGSFLVVPAQSEHPEEAQQFAEWITRPEQQLRAYEAKGPFPSQPEALGDPILTEGTNPFFNDAPTGQILSNRAEALTMQPFKGVHYPDVLAAFQAALLRVDDGSSTPDESWETFVSDAAALG